MDFVGVVLGGDMNSYAVARAFYEEYKIKTIILGKTPLFPTSNSSLCEGYYDENLLDDKVLIKMLTMIDKKYENKKKILFGNTDYYVKHIIHNKDKINKISNNFIIPIVDEKMFDELFAKETFYKLCEKYKLNYPQYKMFDFKKDNIDKFKIDFSYPIFIKPSDTVIYSNFDFSGKQKGYKINSDKELKDTLKLIKKSGFDDKFIIQEYINGTDDTMYVFTAYVSKDHKVKAISAGNILMHDRSPKLIGNYNAIGSAYDEKFSLEIKKFLENIKFTGTCHFDVEYDVIRKKYYVFEMNIRQGRSNMYTLASGMNIAKLIVEDYIYNKDSKFFIANKHFTVSIVPKCLLKYSLNKSGSNYKIENFKRFGLAPYDRNIKRYYYQFMWDKKIMKEFLKYN